MSQGLYKNRNPRASGIFIVIFDDVFRRVWQKRNDVEDYKEVRSLENGEVLSLFLAEARRSTSKTVVAFNTTRGHGKLGKFRVQNGDCAKHRRCFEQVTGKVDAIITSPPYATALPYLDTDRLSLIYLGLLYA